MALILHLGYWSGSRTTFSNAIDLAAEKGIKFSEKNREKRYKAVEIKPASSAWETRATATAARTPFFHDYIDLTTILLL